jgi:hypothetical protein
VEKLAGFLGAVMQSLTFLYDKSKVAERQRQALTWLADRMRWEDTLAGLRRRPAAPASRAA